MTFSTMAECHYGDTMLSIIMLDVTYKPFVQSAVVVSVAMLRVIMLNVTYKPFVLSVITLNAVMPSVVAPF